MNCDRWASLPASSDEERALLAALDGVAARRALPCVAANGSERTLGATLSIEAAEPFDGKADVVVRLAFDEPGPGEGERPARDPWELLDAFLRDAEAEARRRAAVPR